MDLALNMSAVVSFNRSKAEWDTDKSIFSDSNWFHWLSASFTLVESLSGKYLEIIFIINFEDSYYVGQGLVKGAELRLNPYFFGWWSELAGCRSTLSMSEIKVKISKTKYRSFYKTLLHTRNQSSISPSRSYKGSFGDHKIPNTLYIRSFNVQLVNWKVQVNTCIGDKGTIHRQGT